MASFIAAAIAATALLCGYSVRRGFARLKRVEFIRTYTLHQVLYDKPHEKQFEIDHTIDCYAALAIWAISFSTAIHQGGRPCASVFRPQ